jgi:hypothetical protein
MCFMARLENPEVVEHAVHLVARADDERQVKALATLLELGGGAVYYAPEREAVQMLDCDGLVVANIPVSRDVLTRALESPAGL